jgi:hypothetical protein
MKPRYIPPDLKVGDKCWLLRGCLSYEVTISEVRIVLEGDPHQFVSYRVLPDHEVYSYLKNDAVYRHDLFLRPAERKQMIEEIENKIESLEYLKKELEEEMEEETVND